MGRLKGIQKEGKQIPKALQGSEVAISIDGIRGGKDVIEEEYLLTDLNEQDYKLMTANQSFLTSEEKQDIVDTLQAIVDEHNNQI